MGTRGHIRERAGAWEVFLSAGFDPTTGRRRRITRTVHGSRAAAEYILAQLDVLDAEQRPDRRRSHPMAIAPSAGPRWPLGPLLEALGAASTKALAELVGVDQLQVHRWREDGLSDVDADRVACELGLWPGSVWPDWC